jgi:hypothetical protein
VLTPNPNPIRQKGREENMVKTWKARRAVRLLTAGVGAVLCAVSVLASLAVLLAFFTQRRGALDTSLSSRGMTTIGIALLLVAISVLALEARRARPIKRVLATAALICAAGGAVLIWSELGHTPSAKDPGVTIAKAPPGHGSGWKSLHGGGRAKSKANAGKSPHVAGAASAGSGSDEPATGEGGTEEPATSSSTDCKCYSPGGSYVPPPEESWSPEESYESEKSRPEESWEEGEGWDEEEAWEDEGWEDEEGWEEGWDEEEGW